MFGDVNFTLSIFLDVTCAPLFICFPMLLQAQGNLEKVIFGKLARVICLVKPDKVKC
jgi:hypothetical protein